MIILENNHAVAEVHSVEVRQVGLNPDVELLIEKFRKKFWTNVDRKFIHFLGLKKIVLITKYDELLDRNGNILSLITDTNDRLIIFKNDMDMSNKRFGDIQFLKTFTDSDMYWTPYEIRQPELMRRDNVNSLDIKRILLEEHAVDIPLDRLIFSKPLLNAETENQLIIHGYKIASKPMKDRIDSEKESVIMQANSGELYRVPVENSALFNKDNKYNPKHLLLNGKEEIDKKEKQIYTVGDIVKSEDRIYIVVTTNYGGTYENNYELSSYGLVDIKTGDEYIGLNDELTFINHGFLENTDE